MDSKQIIARLGGRTAVAAMCGVNVEAVRKWELRGVPWRYRATVAAICRRRRIALPAQFLSPEVEAA